MPELMDILQETRDAHTEALVRAHVEAARMSGAVGGDPGPEFCQCGERIPEERRIAGRLRCVDCQQDLELREALRR